MSDLTQLIVRQNVDAGGSASSGRPPPHDDRRLELPTPRQDDFPLPKAYIIRRQYANEFLAVLVGGLRYRAPVRVRTDTVQSFRYPTRGEYMMGRLCMPRWMEKHRKGRELAICGVQKQCFGKVFSSGEMAEFMVEAEGMSTHEPSPGPSARMRWV